MLHADLLCPGYFQPITIALDVIGCAQAAYPPNHYIRTVPQRKVHLFTVVQLVQLGVLCAFGFAPLPYLKVVFPILLLLLLPARCGLFALLLLLLAWFGLNSITLTTLLSFL